MMQIPEMIHLRQTWEIEEEIGGAHVERLELPVRTAVPRITAPPTTSRRWFCLPSTVAHQKRLEIPVMGARPKAHRTPTHIPKMVLPTVPLGLPASTRTQDRS